MPWYWTDDLARALLADGAIRESTAARLIAAPVAVRRDEPTVETAARGLLDEDEIPLPALAA